VLAEDFLKAFTKVDVIVTPDRAYAGHFVLERRRTILSSMYLADIYTVTASLAGICGVSVPCGVSSEGAADRRAGAWSRILARGTVFPPRARAPSKGWPFRQTRSRPYSAKLLPTVRRPDHRSPHGFRATSPPLLASHGRPCSFAHHHNFADVISVVAC